ncbi:MAG TPA: DotU family type IV/VI secretion system protein [Gammaproteobacteria bacterium]|nr:DotU family type IV/VI secretion system protein [Gammaproteobacteria bacterium]
MRLIDCYVEFLIGMQRRFHAGADLQGTACDTLRTEVLGKLKACDRQAQQFALPAATLDAARFAVVAYLDELILTSSWPDKPHWQQLTLQRELFHTTNAGAEFYTRLSALGDDDAARAAREVFYLCLALGFRGKFFGEARFSEFAEVKRATLRLLLPDSQGLDLKSVTLFPEAYGPAHRGHKPLAGRWDILPWVFGAPVAALVILYLIYHHYIATALSGIQALLR